MGSERDEDKVRKRATGRSLGFKVLRFKGFKA